MKRRTAIFLSAGIPAGYLPFAYLAIVVYFSVASIFGCDNAIEKHTILWYFGMAAIILTIVQWPFYFVWVALSPELTLRQKSEWWIMIFIGNMFVMPYFLWCKYHGKVVEGLLSITGRKNNKE